MSGLSSEEALQKQLITIRGQYRSSHRSVFPAKSADAFVDQQKEELQTLIVKNSSNINSITLVLGNGSKFSVPAMLAFYMQPRPKFGPKYSYVVPFELAEALSGNTKIFVYVAKDNFKEESQCQKVGWVEYAHPDGKAYSGTDQVFGTVSVQTYNTTCSDELMEFGEWHKSVPAADVRSIAPANRETYYMYVTRMQIIEQLASQPSTFKASQLMEWWNAEGTCANLAAHLKTENMDKHYSKLEYDVDGNLFIKFPPIAILGQQQVGTEMKVVMHDAYDA